MGLGALALVSRELQAWSWSSEKSVIHHVRRHTVYRHTATLESLMTARAYRQLWCRLYLSPMVQRFKNPEMKRSPITNIWGPNLISLLQRNLFDDNLTSDLLVFNYILLITNVATIRMLNRIELELRWIVESKILLNSTEYIFLGTNDRV